jgi:UDP-N-acetylmuramoyl-L-alanyl-D-glutamate--2,6-diaminopimelate ligase
MTTVTIEALRDRLPWAAQATVVGDPTAGVPTVTHDSRAVTAGAMFACLRGSHFDGHQFAAAAVAAGATSLLVDHALDQTLLGGSAVSQLVVADTRVALGPVAAAVNGDPSTALRVVGVTGTNGKTTTSAMLASILRATGDPTGVIGTLSGVFTTPEAPELQERLAAMVAEGDRSVVMEVSSHALALHRADGTRFDAAVFTNLGRDHLDLHGTQEEYFRAKARLFEQDRARIGVVNVDDVHGRLLFDAAPVEMVPFSRADVSSVTIAPGALHFTWQAGDDAVRIDVPMGGSFNVMNALAAATTARALGVSIDDIVVGLATLPPVPGRFERVVLEGAPAPIDVIVDFAHTPDGLEQVITAAASSVTGRGRVIVVFGAGGDRDRDKRPVMGATAARLADVVVVTSDNPRSEDPQDIIDAVVAGVAAEDRRRVEIEPDRAAAIGHAIAIAEPGDIVVIAGKGHETTQTIGDVKHPFDDRQVARQALERRR